MYVMYIHMKLYVCNVMRPSGMKINSTNS